MNAYQQLEQTFEQMSRLEHLHAITSWDEAVMMPVGSGESRAKAMAYVQQLIHEKLVDERNGDLILQAKLDTELLPWQQRNLELMHKAYVKSNKIPAALVNELAETTILAEQAWRQMRANNNWLDFKPYLEKMLGLIKEVASIKAQALGVNPYDALIDDFSPEITQAQIEPIFSELKQQLPSMIDEVIAYQQSRDIQPVSGVYATELQQKMAQDLMKMIGFDFNKGRLDVSHHPFCGGVADDVRITTRFDENNFVPAMMGVCHETGHALYEMGLDRTRLTQPVGLAYGLALHESQSLLIEMQVCRSQAFMQVFSGLLEQYFGNHDKFSAENLYRHYTQVKRSFIRVDADEVTYPLHIILRYEIEQGLLNNTLTVSDLPDVWDEKMTALLGVSTKDNYADGVMQDVHWPCGAFGYFPSYTLGAMIGAQLFSAAKRDGVVNDEAISQGNLVDLIQWLRVNVHHVGSSKPFNQLLLDATGDELSSRYFIEHIRARYLA